MEWQMTIQFASANERFLLFGMDVRSVEYKGLVLSWWDFIGNDQDEGKDCGVYYA